MLRYIDAHVSRLLVVPYCALYGARDMLVSPEPPLPSEISTFKALLAIISCGLYSVNSGKDSNNGLDDHGLNSSSHFITKLISKTSRVPLKHRVFKQFDKGTHTFHIGAVVLV